MILSFNTCVVSYIQTVSLDISVPQISPSRTSGTTQTRMNIKHINLIILSAFPSSFLMKKAFSVICCCSLPFFGTSVIFPKQKMTLYIFPSLYFWHVTQKSHRKKLNKIAITILVERSSKWCEIAKWWNQIIYRWNRNCISKNEW